MTRQDDIAWLHAHASYIENRLNIHRTNLKYEVVNFKLIISDLQLCGAIETMDNPPGYEWTQKRVTNSSSGLVRSHRFYESTTTQGDHQTILDYLAGQFFADEDGGVSGIQLAFAMSPDLFIKLTEQLYVLYATREYISKKLGLIY